MFASESVAEHLLRGAAGLSALAAALAVGPDHPVAALGAAAGGLLALRGCPMCWTLGLLETAAAALQGRRASPACLDGSCAAKRVGPPPRP
jgi:hypothetical protein